MIKGNAKMTFWMIAYVCCSAMGLVLIKLGISKSFGLNVKQGVFEMKIHLILIVGALIYITSFLLSLFVMSKMNMSLYYPISAGLIYSLICLLSIVLLKEKITTTNMIGMIVILAGVVIMSLGGRK